MGSPINQLIKMFRWYCRRCYCGVKFVITFADGKTALLYFTAQSTTIWLYVAYVNNCRVYDVRHNGWSIVSWCAVPLLGRLSFHSCLPSLYRAPKLLLYDSIDVCVCILEFGFSSLNTFLLCVFRCQTHLVVALLAYDSVTSNAVRISHALCIISLFISIFFFSF